MGGWLGELWLAGWGLVGGSQAVASETCLLAVWAGTVSVVLFALTQQPLMHSLRET